jgi:hypothetical protein
MDNRDIVTVNTTYKLSKNGVHGCGDKVRCEEDEERLNDIW